MWEEVGASILLLIFSHVSRVNKCCRFEAVLLSGILYRTGSATHAMIKGHSLSCYECTGLTGSCVDQKLKTCPGGSSQCLSLTAARQDLLSVKVKVKDCAVDCQSGFMNLGNSKMSSSCCNTDQCNVQDAPDPSNTHNGKKCFYCDGQTC
ncbi:ly6/PLAUR domain-containing protein 2-like [Pimephales promelas]|uniref:ly6/PLAUR domain-containing protein 2-like n=1 Tax=Pimephales promelas TaxID=90988 RepID=UPI001955E29F|nr:ly6/PLAUR domain-containing protein 2-like [Pimephales promelas]